MGEQLFYTYNSGGSVTESKYKSNAHTYSPIFDSGTHGIFVQGEEYGTYVIDKDHHYSPTYDNTTHNSSASGGSESWGSSVVSGVTVKTDNKGHVTGVSVTSVKTPQNLSAGSGTAAAGKFVKEVNVSGHTVTASYDYAINGVTGTKGENNVITDITYSNNIITVTYGKVYGSINGTKGSNNVVTDVSVGSDGKTLNITYGSFQPAGNYGVVGTYAPVGTAVVSLSGSYETTGYLISAGTYDNTTYSVRIPLATGAKPGVTYLTYAYLSANYQPVGNYQPAGSYAPIGTAVVSLSGTTDDYGYSITAKTNDNTTYKARVPIATSSVFGVVKSTSNSGKVKVENDGTMTYRDGPDPKSGKLKYKVNDTQYNSGFNANSQSEINILTLKSGTNITVSYANNGEITFDHNTPATGTVVSGTSTTITAGTSKIIQNIEVNKDSQGHIISFTYAYGTMPNIPAAPGTLNTNVDTTQSVNSSEALSGTIKLHKVSKTGKFSDLIGAPAMGDYVTQSTLSAQAYLQSGALTDYVTQTTLSNQGYLQSGALTDYITKTQLKNQSYVTKSDLSNQSYVTQTTLTNQGYLQSGALTDYVTKTQLKNQSYVTKSDLSNQSYITQTTLTNQGYLQSGALTDYVTKTQLKNQSYVTQNTLSNQGYLQSETQLSLGSASGGTGKAITALSVSGTNNHTITPTYGTFITSETPFALTGTKGDNNVVTNLVETSEHTVTVSYDKFPTYTYLSTNYATLDDVSFDLTLEDDTNGNGLLINAKTTSLSVETDVTIPLMTSSAYGVAKSYHDKYTTNVKVESASTTANRWYGVRPS